MIISSVPTSCSTTSSDTITIGNITTSTTGIYYTGSGISNNSGTITFSNGGTGSSGSSFTIGGAGSGYEWSYKIPEEFVDAFPEWQRITKMCEEYPGLKIAFEKFKTTYYLVKDHYDTPEDQRPLP